MSINRARKEPPLIRDTVSKMNLSSCAFKVDRLHMALLLLSRIHFKLNGLRVGSTRGINRG